MGIKEISLLLNRVTDLSTLPEVTQRILTVTEDPDSSARDLNEILKHDLALSAKLLRVVNSAFYGLPGHVADIDRAIVLLGFQAVRNLAISATMAGLFGRPGAEVRGFTVQNLWRHCVATAVAARCIVSTVGLRSLREEAFLSGIIHDVGVLVEYQYASKQFTLVVEKVNAGGTSLVAAEEAILELNHQDIGKALTERWKFPKGVQMVVAYHHRPARLAQEHRLLPAVVAVAGEMADACGYKYLDFGQEGAMPDGAEVNETVNLSPKDREAVAQALPELVAQANGWLDLG
jgi:HD-like signal output (HDOD) protein